MALKVLENNIPKDWLKLSLGDVADITNGKTNSQDAVSGGIYPLFDRSVSIKNSDKFLFDKTAIILPGEGSEFIPRYFSGKFDLHQRAYAIFANEDKVHASYLYYFLLAKRAVFAQTAVGSTVKSLRLPIIKAVQVNIPPISEQKIIAEILSSTDYEIQKVEKIIFETEKLKHGLLAELFTKGVGHNKLKKTKLGEIPNEWEVGPLGSFLTEKPSYGIGAAAVDYSKDLPTYIRITDISEDGQFLYKNKKSVDSKESGNYLLQDGDLLFARTGASVGKTYLYDPRDGELVFAGFLIRVKVNTKKILPKYLSYFVQTSTYWNWVHVMSARSGQPGINGNEYSSMPIAIPSLQEQEKVIQILSSVDTKISLNRQLKEKLNQLEKGLMSDLLSGKVRTI